jgi:fused signal recognition particle receptor
VFVNPWIAKLAEWFDLAKLDPLVRLIGLQDHPDAGRIAVLAGAAIILLIAVYLIRLPFRGAKRPSVAAAEREARPPVRRSADEIEADLERAVDELPVSEEELAAEAEAYDAPEGAEPVGEFAEDFQDIEEAAEEPVPPPPAPKPALPAVPPVEAPAPPVEIAAEKPLTKEGLFARLRAGLAKTKAGLLGRIDALLPGRKIDDALFEELEEVLIGADLGVQTTYRLLETLRQRASRGELKDGDALKAQLRDEIRAILTAVAKPFDVTRAKPLVVLVCGVNGVGKTTTIGKLAKRFTDEGRKTMMVAADTFRAAAIEQLEIWAGRVGADFIKQRPGADPSAVAFDGISAAEARGTDVVIVDTAGRLHTKANLMDEIKKVKRVVAKKTPGAPHEVFLVLDATTGQNAIQQAKQFHETLELTGIILTKLDGTAKGGVIVGIADELKVPIRYIGIGERLDDLREFAPADFVDALFAE